MTCQVSTWGAEVLSVAGGLSTWRPPGHWVKGWWTKALTWAPRDPQPGSHLLAQLRTQRGVIVIIMDHSKFYYLKVKVVKGWILYSTKIYVKETSGIPVPVKTSSH